MLPGAEYFLLSEIFEFGGRHTIMAGMPYETALRIAMAMFGAVLYVATVWILAIVVNPFARDRAGYACLFSNVSGVFDPLGIRLFFISTAPAALGGSSGMMGGQFDAESRRHTRDPSFYPRDFGWTYDSTNRFACEIQNYSDSVRRWADGTQRKIEDYMEEIVYGLRACAAYEKRRRIEQEAEQKRADERLRIRMKQQARVERLRTNMSRWEDSQRVRAYLEAVRKKVRERDGELKERSLIARFLAWGDRYADELDPTGNPASSDWDEDN